MAEQGERTLVRGHAPAVQDALQSAGLSRGSELSPQQATRAEALASGQVQFDTDDSRREFIMRGRGGGGERRMAKDENGNTKSEARLKEVLTILKRFKRPITRAELNEKAAERGTLEGLVGDDPKGLGPTVSDSATNGDEIDGFRVKRAGRGKYEAEKVEK